MTEAMKSIASLTRGMLKAGGKVSFTKEELNELGIKVPKSKLHLIKTSEETLENSINIKLPAKDLQFYKSLGKGYIDIMANILSNALKQPSLLREATPIYKTREK